ncbi:MAG: DUF3035 domain-containing protein [Rickettsiaceae bacterium]|nr:DUF3035 domain-containing protein [Rickettsiaceae bacterium]MDP5082679.1 DUF3035 domain-containing protein [Rickettsiaceae bacterium]
MKKILLLSAVLIITSACSKNTKKTLGLTETLPDEYQVQRNKSLEIPPCYQANTSTKPKNEKPKNKNLSKAEQALLDEIK